MNRMVLLGALATSFALAGCASNPLPPARVTDTQASIAAADAVGAANNPRAALHLKLAREQLQQGEALLRDGDDDEARLVLERARIDAELALALTREEQARKESKVALEKARDVGRQ
jgi:hypothetical protein